jgi:hypothetical protein
MHLIREEQEEQWGILPRLATDAMTREGTDASVRPRAFEPWIRGCLLTAKQKGAAEREDDVHLTREQAEVEGERPSRWVDDYEDCLRSGRGKT